MSNIQTGAERMPHDLSHLRSEERRVGKECRSRWSSDPEKNKRRISVEQWIEALHFADGASPNRQGKPVTRAATAEAADHLVPCAVHGMAKRLQPAKRIDLHFVRVYEHLFFFKQKTAYEVGLGIPAEPLFRSYLRINYV